MNEILHQCIPIKAQCDIVTCSTTSITITTMFSLYILLLFMLLLCFFKETHKFRHPPHCLYRASLNREQVFLY